MKLLPVEEARARMLAEIAPLSAETIPLSQSVGRVLAEDVAARRDQLPEPTLTSFFKFFRGRRPNPP